MLRFISLSLRIAVSFFGFLGAVQTASAKDYAIIFSYDCDRDLQAGPGLWNMRQVLNKFDWNVSFYCGQEGRWKNDPAKAGASGPLSADTVNSALEYLEVKEGDNVLVILNTHGEASETEFQLLSPGGGPYADDRPYGTQKISVKDVISRLEDLDAKNGTGITTLINDSCYSGSCLVATSPETNLCIITAAPETTVGKTGNFIDTAFYALAGSTGAGFSPALNREDSKKIENTRQLIKPASTRIKDIFGESLQHDDVTEAAYTTGYGIDRLNIFGSDEKFLSGVSNLIEGLKGTQAREAIALMNAYQSAVQTLTLQGAICDNAHSQAKTIWLEASQEYDKKYWNSISRKLYASELELRRKIRLRRLKEVNIGNVVFVSPEADAKEILRRIERDLKDVSFGKNPPDNPCEEAGVVEYTPRALCNELSRLVHNPTYLDDMNAWLEDQLAGSQKCRQASQTLEEILERRRALRNRLTALALSNSNCACGEFDLDRRSSTK